MIEPVVIQDLQLEPRVYFIPEGLTIDADNITLDGRGATLVGTDKMGEGIRVLGRKKITIKNLNIMNFYHGISLRKTEGIEISNCHITSTAENPSNTIFLDVWKDAASPYGSAIYLEEVTGARIHDNNLQHQMNGVLSYRCKRLELIRNNASYSSGFGFHLFETCDSLFAENYADYCCRYYLSESGSHLGADAAGFLIVFKSCNNVFRNNYARLGGDGFFLAGLAPGGMDVGCNDNVFEENDASYSPNNAFEGVFSRGNIYRRNNASYSNYGFWLGFSSGCVISDNRLHGNHQAGIAVENGIGFEVTNNDIRNNAHGILIWSRTYDFLKNLPDINTTSRDWLIERNRLMQNKKAVRIAANQDHGIRALRRGPLAASPQHHTIQNNEFRDNLVGIELERAVDTQLRANTMHNFLADLDEK